MIGSRIMTGAVIAVLAGSMSGCLLGASELGRDFEAVVGAVGERPCFGVEDNAETRRSAPVVAFVEVSGRVDGRAERVWHGVLASDGDSEAKRLPPGECVEYPEDGDDSARPLSSGKAYSATLWAYLDNAGRSGRRWYTAYFCMIDERGSLRPYQVMWSEKAGGWDWSACGPGVRW